MTRARPWRPHARAALRAVTFALLAVGACACAGATDSSAGAVADVVADPDSGHDAIDPVGRSDGASGDAGGVDTLPVDTLPVDTLPVDTLPVDTLPVDTLPVDAATALDGGSADGAPWQSVLVKEGWHPVPGPAGERLIDYSWAGYHNGAAPLPQPTTPAVSVLAHGADASGATDSTAAIQAAIDAVAQLGGGVVALPAGTFRVDGTLLVTASGTVLRGAGPAQTRLWFTKHVGMSHKAHLTFRGQPKVDLVAPAHLPPGSTSGPSDLWPGYHVNLPPKPTLQKGDELALTVLITPGFVADHGMTGTWKAFNGKRVRFWRSRVTKLTPSWHGSTVVGRAPGFPGKVTYRDKPQLERVTGYLSECGVEELSVGNAVDWDDAWAQNQVRAIGFEGVRDCWARNVHSFDPPGPKQEGHMPGAHLQSSGIVISDSTRVTVQGCHLQRAQHRGGGGNGYLFEIRQSTHVLTRDCIGQQGRHNFIQNWGFGTAGCVWTGLLSEGGKAMISKDVAFAPTAFSEFHHSLAMFNLVEDSVLNDGWASRNRGDWSSGAGHTATQNTLWNVRGTGVVISRNFGHGYVVGTGPKLQVSTAVNKTDGAGTAPEDWVEGQGQAATLTPQSLWASQRKHRLNL